MLAKCRPVCCLSLQNLTGLINEHVMKLIRLTLICFSNFGAKCSRNLAKMWSAKLFDLHHICSLVNHSRASWTVEDGKHYQKTPEDSAFWLKKIEKAPHRRGSWTIHEYVHSPRTFSRNKQTNQQANNQTDKRMIWRKPQVIIGVGTTRCREVAPIRELLPLQPLRGLAFRHFRCRYFSRSSPLSEAFLPARGQYAQSESLHSLSSSIS